MEESQSVWSAHTQFSDWLMGGNRAVRVDITKPCGSRAVCSWSSSHVTSLIWWGFSSCESNAGTVPRLLLSRYFTEEQKQMRLVGGLSWEGPWKLLVKGKHDENGCWYSFRWLVGNKGVFGKFFGRQSSFDIVIDSSELKILWCERTASVMEFAST